MGSQSHYVGTNKIVDMTKFTQHIKQNSIKYFMLKIACAPWKDSDQPAHPCSLISIFVVYSMGS